MSTINKVITIKLNGINKLTLAMVFLSVSLLACGSKKVVVTKDNSADYRSAVSLPPLKKTTVKAVPRSQNDALVESASENTEDQSANIGNATENDIEAYTVGALDYRVIEKGPKHAWLEIDAKFATAWDYLGDKLSNSDITVHHRNKDASLIAIGCGDADVGDASKKKSRWSIFKRKQEPTEHCALRLTTSKARTKVMVFNRSGIEFDAAAARDVFARLLKG